MLNPLRDGTTFGQSFPNRVTIFSIAVEMLRLSHWIEFTRIDKIKIATVLYCFQRNRKRANNPKEGERI